MATQTVPPPVRHLLSVHAFHRMGEAGILAGHDRIELIDGGLIDNAPKAPRASGGWLARCRDVAAVNSRRGPPP